jgi:predicted PurR-regulated permease PerM
MSALQMAPEMSDADRPRTPFLRSVPARNGLMAAILVIVGVAALRFASSLLVPITVSMLLALLLGPAVRWLRKFGVPSPIGAAVIVFGAVGLIGAGAALLARPAADWLQRAPETLPVVEAKIRKLVRPISAISRTAEQVQSAATPGASEVQKVQVQSPALMTTGATVEAFAAFFTVLFLTYFLASTENLFKRKLIALIHDRTQQARAVRAVTEIERQTTRYLALTTLISLGVGLGTWGLLAVAGLPNGALWGTVAAALNFIPYLGTLVSAVLIGGACLITFDGIEKTIIVLAAFLFIHGITGNLLTPILLGRALPLNKVALFVGLVFWTWVWGVPGAILAVPVTVMIKVVCDHVERLKPIGVLLDS